MVSVIISTYGRSVFLESAIKSVLEQTYKNIEIIVVDDNANLPDVRNQVKVIVEKYPQIRLVLNEKNLGGSLSRNEGIKVAKGNLISFLDDDDTYFPNRIEKCVDAYNKTDDVGFIYTYCQAVDEKGKILCSFKRKPEKNPLLQHLLCSCLCATSQWVVPKKTFDDVGCFDDTPCKQDSIMLLKILGNKKKVLCVDEVLSNYTVHQKGRISGNYQRNVIGLNNYRNKFLCYAGLLSDKERIQVNYVFSKDLIYCYAALNDRKKALVELKKMLDERFSLIVLFRFICPILLGRFYGVMFSSFYRMLKTAKTMLRS